MATIPDITAFRPATPRPAGGVASYRPEEPRLDGFVNAGRLVEEAAQTIAATNERQDTMTAQSAANGLAQKRLSLQLDPQNGFALVKGGNAVGQPFIDKYTEQFKAEQDGIRSGLLNPNQQRIFDQHAEVEELRFRSALMAHQAQQTDQFNEQTENDAINLARSDVFASPGDPSAVSAALARMDWAINQKAQRQGWPEETTRAVKEKYLSSVYQDTVDQMVERDPLGTLPLLNKRLGVGEEPALTGNAAIDGLDPKHLVDFRHRAEAYRSTLQNRAEAEGQARLKDAAKATEELQKFVMLGQVVSPQYGAMVRAQVAGTPAEGIADSLIKLSYAGAAFGSRPLSEQANLLRQMDAEAAQGSSPDQADLIKLARNAHEGQVAAYKENPWAAATRFGRQPQTPEANITSPDQLPKLVQERSRSQSVVEQYAGDTVSALQPNEAAQAAKLLRTLPPDQAAMALSQMGIAADSTERISALATSLGKNDPVVELQLLAAGDKTTAGRYVAELIGRGSQALADKSIKPDDTRVTGWKAEIAGLVNGTLNNPAEEEKVKKAAFYVRAAMEDPGATAQGYKSIGDASAESAVAMVVGRPITRGGVKTLLPRGMTETDFDAALRRFTPEVLTQMAVAAEPHYDAGTRAKVLQGIETGKGMAGDAPGMLQPGNIDVSNRPKVKNPDGSVSTILSFSTNIDGKEVLLPQVVGGKVLSQKAAIEHYRKTGQMLGAFDSPQTAEAYAQLLHEQQAGKADEKTLYFNGQPVQPSFVYNRIDALPLARFGGGQYVPLQNGRPFYLDAAGTKPLVLKVTP